MACDHSPGRRTSDTAFSVFSTRVTEILYWTEPGHSAAAVATINLLFYLITFGGYTVPQLFVLTLWVSLISRFVFVVGLHGLAIFKPEYKNIPDMLGDTEASISEADFKPISDTLLGALNWFNTSWDHVSSCRDTYLVMKVLGMLHIASFVASFFSLSGLSYIGVFLTRSVSVDCICRLAAMGLFIIPRVFNDHKEKIMDVFTQVKAQAEGKIEVVLDAIPKASQCKANAGKKTQ